LDIQRKKLKEQSDKLSKYTKYDAVIQKYDKLLETTKEIEIIPKKNIQELLD